MQQNPFQKFVLIKAAFLTVWLFLGSCENSLDQLNQFSTKRSGVEEAKGVKIIYAIGDKVNALSLIHI